jgi:TonB family protein
VFLPALCLASAENDSARMPGQWKNSLGVREQQLWKPASRDSRFADVPHTNARSSCEATRQPEALTTPNPLLDVNDIGIKVTVSFIIGTDGKVYSPLILESAGSGEDRTVLQTVRSWRYRPAICNGVPTETEGKVEFSSR